jgi:L-lysine exporter family protein LysE/ArgO
MLGAAGQGFLLGLSLIVAIGAQNAFVLRQGLLRRHVLVVCLICALSDALLIAAGVAGFGALVQRLPALPQLMGWLGAVFLFWYGLTRFREALRTSGLRAAEEGAGSLSAAVTACLAFTWLNPHVYLDTVVLLGGIATRFAGSARLAFGLGAAAASFLFFFALGYGARLLAPWFARPGAWRVLDTAVGFTMWLLAFKLVAG